MTIQLRVRCLWVKNQEITCRGHFLSHRTIQLRVGCQEIVFANSKGGQSTTPIRQVLNTYSKNVGCFVRYFYLPTTGEIS